MGSCNHRSGLKERRNTYFLSDLHLGSRWYADPHDAEKRVVAFLNSVKDDAKAIYFVGDVLDYWFEYRYVVPRGYVRFFGKIAELSDAGVKITWLRGNHDIWIFDYLPKELGIEVVTGTLIRDIDGSRFFIEHGDGVGERPVSLKILRGVFHNRFCQRLFSGVHPRWTVPLAYGWSRSNRGHHPEPAPYLGADKEPLMRFAAEYLAQEEIDYFIFGHRHILVEERLEAEVAGGGKRTASAVILGEWINTCSYAVFDGQDLRLCRFI